MSVKIIKGDMVLSYKNFELYAYAHQCNCFCRMERGIAPALAKINKEIRKVDNQTIEGDRDKKGTISIVDTEDLKVVYRDLQFYMKKECY